MHHLLRRSTTISKASSSAPKDRRHLLRCLQNFPQSKSARNLTPLPVFQSRSLAYVLGRNQRFSSSTRNRRSALGGFPVTYPEKFRQFSALQQTDKYNHEERGGQASTSNNDAEGLKKYDGLPYWIENPIDLEIFNAETPSKQMAIASKYNLTAKQAVSLLSCMGRVAGANFFQSKNLDSEVSSQFLNLIGGAMEGGGSSSEFMPAGDAMMALKSLLFLGLTTASPAVRSLQKRLLDVANLIPAVSLVTFSVMHAAYRESSELSAQLQAKLESRLKLALHSQEAIKPEDTLLLMNKIPYKGGGVVRTDWQKLLERQALMNVAVMDANQCVRLMVILCALGSRNMILLKAASSQLISNLGVEPLTMKQIMSLLNVCGTLSFVNRQLLDKICQDLKSHFDESGAMEEIKVQTVGVLFQHFGVIQWCDSEILSRLCNYVDRNLDRMNNSDLVSMILTLAKCNFRPMPDTGFLSRVRNKFAYDKFIVEGRAEGIGPTENRIVRRHQIWLDVVYALGVLEELSEELGKSVLDKGKEETIKLMIDPSRLKHLLNRQRLKQVEACLRLDLEVESIEIADCLRNIESRRVFFGKPPQLEVTDETAVKFRPSDLLCAVMHHIAPRETHSVMQSWDQYGHFIDCEIVYGEQGRPMAVKDWDSVKFGAKKTKIAVLSWDWADYVNGMEHQILNGHAAMRLRHLEKMGFIGVQVPFNELKQIWKFAGKVEHMQNKIDAVIKNEIKSAKGD